MFKLHHIQLAVSCITGVEIKKDQIVNTMMGTECPVSLAFEGDKVVVVNNDKVVFYTTSKEYSDDVQKFLDITRAVRNMRKDLKGMEKQAKAYSAPDKEAEEKLQQKVLAAMKRLIPPVDLSKLQEGDVVRMRNGRSRVVTTVLVLTRNSTFPYHVLLDGDKIIHSYGVAGNFLNLSEHPSDIVEVIHIHHSTI